MNELARLAAKAHAFTSEVPVAIKQDGAIVEANGKLLEILGCGESGHWDRSSAHDFDGAKELGRTSTIDFIIIPYLHERRNALFVRLPPKKSQASSRKHHRAPTQQDKRHQQRQRAPIQRNVPSRRDKHGSRGEVKAQAQHTFSGTDWDMCAHLRHIRHLRPPGNVASSSGNREAEMRGN